MLSPFRKSLLGCFSFSLLLMLVGVEQNISGQTPQAVPVARLLSFSSDSVSASRPRRVLKDVAVVNTYPLLNDATEIERRVFEMTNAARVRSGLASLIWDAELCRMARAHSEQMVRLGFFSHQTPDGLRMRDRAHAAGIQHFRVLGENIAYNQSYPDPGGFVVDRWMLSPGHRANILSREFDRSAVGSFVALDGTVYVTQEFIKR
jgi:uncharacterized protein YkwD